MTDAVLIAGLTARQIIWLAAYYEVREKKLSSKIDPDSSWSAENRLPTADPVNHPSHYNSHPSGVECITVTRHMNFNLGNAVKYIWRAGEKGNIIQDLEKAVWYLNDEIQRLKNEPKSRP